MAEFSHPKATSMKRTTKKVNGSKIYSFLVAQHYQHRSFAERPKNSSLQWFQFIQSGRGHGQIMLMSEEKSANKTKVPRGEFLYSCRFPPSKSDLHTGIIICFEKLNRRMMVNSSNSSVYLEFCGITEVVVRPL